MYKKRTAPKRKFARRKVAKRGKGRSSIKRVVKQVLARNLEVKSGAVFVDGNNIRPATAGAFSVNPIGYDTTFNGIGVAIAQGVGVSNRIGNRITNKKVTLALTLTPNPYNASTNLLPQPVYVQVILFQDRTDPTALPNPISDFYQVGNVDVAMTGVISDMMLPVNIDKYKVFYKKSFKIGYAGYAGGTGGTPTAGGYANNDFKLNQMVRIDCTRFFPKIIRYNENNTSPTTNGVFMMVLPFYANGTAVPAAAIVANYSCVNTVRYTDA